ncbi:hypothetical protein BS78_09G250600 [Paspalum vaginatum]|nr:hypothetical protein BS78_09G250600 [Paspalum vaginatum]
MPSSSSPASTRATIVCDDAATASRATTVAAACIFSGDSTIICEDVATASRARATTVIPSAAAAACTFSRDSTSVLQPAALRTPIVARLGCRERAPCLSSFLPCPAALFLAVAL